MTRPDELLFNNAALYLGVTGERLRQLVKAEKVVGRVVMGKKRVFTTAKLDAYRKQFERNRAAVMANRSAAAALSSPNDRSQPCLQ